MYSTNYLITGTLWHVYTNHQPLDSERAKKKENRELWEKKTLFFSILSSVNKPLEDFLCASLNILQPTDQHGHF